jgi:apolipoprotein N-acyltransferase
VTPGASAARRALLLVVPALAGALTVFAYAPFGVPGLEAAMLAVLFFAWQHAERARDAARAGFAFGVGLFGAGVSWVYVALKTFGGMPAPVAVVATAGFVAYLALWPALAGYLGSRITAPTSVGRAIACVAAWALCEWLRGFVLSGFGWLALGYAELPSSPLRGYAPVGGVFLVSLAVAAIAMIAALVVDALAANSRRTLLASAFVLILVVALGEGLARIDWTRSSGPPLRVSLVQGNILQEVKFDRAFRLRTIDIYTDLIERSRGTLIVLPESAFPMFADQVPGAAIERLRAIVTARDATLLLGLFTAEPPLPGQEQERYYNTVVMLDARDADLYRKRHLVPFGETIPADAVFGWFIRRVLSIPIANQTPGDAAQPPFAIAGQRVAVNICYEDAFGGELIGDARGAAILVNVTNDAWYGESIAAYQHNQISAMRALETGRPMLRATNTGITSTIGHDGREVSRLPWFTRGILETEVQGRSGETPYVRFGDWLVVGLSIVFYAAAFWLARKRR